jgi:Tfp pilus assembly protein PilN
MIRVNLAGIPKKKAAKAAAKAGGPSKSLPILHLLLMIGTAVAGYLWYSSLNTKTEDLATQITTKETELKKLDAINKADAIYEERKATLERRIKIIDGLKKDQVSPVVMLDQLAEAIDNTRFVWLSNFTQSNNTNLNLQGTATSIDALAAFISNLQSSGYFKNVTFNKFEGDSAKANVAFTVTCEFAPPAPPKTAVKEAN